MVHKVLAILLFLPILVFAQNTETGNTESTPNLIDPTKFTGQQVTGTWNGVNIRDHVFGCCTGGPGSAVDTSGGGSIWFAWGWSTVGQTIAINKALSGTGISVIGFTYSYNWYNYGWNRGTLSASINVTDVAGKQVESYYWGHSPNQKDGWQLNTGTKIFTNPYELQNLGSISMSFTGKDDRYWAGYWGPAVSNPSLKLNYTVDTCSGNSLSNPNCPGYLENISKITSSSVSTIDTTSYNTVIETPTVTTVSIVENPQPTIQQSTTSPVQSTQTTNTQQSNVTVVENKPETKEDKNSTVNLSNVLANIRNNQDKQQSIAMSAVAMSNDIATSVIQKAEQIASESVKESIQQATESQQNSYNDNNKATLSVANNQNIQNENFRNTQISNNNTNNSVVTYSLVDRLEPNSIVAVSVVNNNHGLKIDSKFMDNNSENTIQITEQINIQKPYTVESITNNTIVENIQNNNIVFGKRNDPVQDYIEKNTTMFSTDTVQNKNVTVNQSVQDNDLAGNVSIASLGSGPNLTSYTNILLKDAIFYIPKEIYRNQRVIDNARALRQLSSDRLHKELVEQQYRRITNE